MWRKIPKEVTPGVAPWDGHRILLTGWNSHVQWVCIGSWMSHMALGWVSDDHTRYPPRKLHEPTDWQPLPSPPGEPQEPKTMPKRDWLPEFEESKHDKST